MKHTMAGICVLVLLGCADPTAHTQSPPLPQRGNELFQTDTTSYVARRVGEDASWPAYTFDVITRFSNTHVDTLYLGRCSPDDPKPQYYVELMDSVVQFGSAFNAFWGCGGHEYPIPVAPGEARVDTIKLRGPNLRTQDGKFPGELEGIMRLGFRLQTCRRETGCLLPVEQRVSNRFRVTLQK